jgi:hypothetical protein
MHLRRAFWMCSVLAAWLLAPPAATATPSRPLVRHYKLALDGAAVDVVRVDLRNPLVRIVPVVAPHLKASFAQLIHHYQPLAAINGTFFDTATWRITGNVVLQGKLLHEGYVGNAIAITRDNRPRLVRNSGQLGRHTDWSPFLCAIGGGPTLLDRGRIQLDPAGEGFHDPGLFRMARRSAVGYTRAGTLFLVSVKTPVSFHRLADIMADLGLYSAISLDGGSSTALYVRGRFVNRPSRLLTNLLAVYKSARPLPRPKKTKLARPRKAAASAPRSRLAGRATAARKKQPARSRKAPQAHGPVLAFRAPRTCWRSSPPMRSAAGLERVRQASAEEVDLRRRRAGRRRRAVRRVG